MHMTSRLSDQRPGYEHSRAIEIEIEKQLAVQTRRMMAATDLQLYSREEVSKHDNASDAWVVVDGRVYDITAFLDSHPGGLGVTEEHLGSDVSAVVRSPDVHEHSSTAFDLLPQYCIGKVEREVRWGGLRRKFFFLGSEVVFFHK